MGGGVVPVAREKVWVIGVGRVGRGGGHGELGGDDALDDGSQRGSARGLAG